MRLLLAGLRYRFATGLRYAMRLWMMVLLAIAIAEGLEVGLPFLRWGREWMAAPLASRLAVGLAVVIALAILVRPLLRHALRGAGHEAFATLPLTNGQRFAVDLVAVCAFMLPPWIVLLVMVRARPEAIALLLLGAVAQTLTLGGRVTSTTSAGAATPFPYEIGWLVRANGKGIVNGELMAIACVVGAELAIRNNDVVNTHSIARIASLFAALGASALATEIVRARRLARPKRNLEAVLPLDAGDRLRALLVAAVPFAAPMVILFAFLRPVVAPFALVTFIALLLFGEDRALRGKKDGGVSAAGGAAAILGALDARLALAVLVVLVPFFWRFAILSDRREDLPVTPAETLT